MSSARHATLEMSSVFFMILSVTRPLRRPPVKVPIGSTMHRAEIGQQNIEEHDAAEPCYGRDASGTRPFQDKE